MRVARSIADSEPYAPIRGWRNGSPNVVVVVLDDVGFAQLGCFGSDLDTPSLDRIASAGLRFTNFHTTALCSPSRASLLTGRNHHRVGLGWHPDLPMRFPGYTGRIPPSAATMAEVLRTEGWATYAVGKWHLTPTDERSPAGPFTQWPTGKGFEHFYGFLGGDTNQWTPCLVSDTTYVDPPAAPEDGYHLNDDLADHAIGFISELRAYQPDRPFFLYYATGAAHAPHHAPQEWIDRYAGRFDEGWDQWRADTLARQQELGIVPADAELSPRPPWVDAWDEMSDDERRFCARTMEVFAAYLAHTDAAIGRVLDAIDAAGELDDTIVVVMSDNGASGQGGPHGSVNEMRFIAQIPESLERDIVAIDDLGGFRTYNHYSWGWALAGNTPLQRWKKYTWEGGSRDPMILKPRRGGDPDADGAIAGGTLRSQYCHVTDIFPTVLSMCGLAVPEVVAGVDQMSVDGVDLSPVVRDATHDEVRTTQYYELEGSRAIYHDGWKAVTNHVYQGQVSERELVVGSHDVATDHWHLIDTRADFAENHDVGAQHPDRRAELIELWWYEAGRNQVLPIVDTVDGRQAAADRRWASPVSRATLPPGGRLFHTGVPMLHRTDFRITARMHESGRLGEGVLAEMGDWNGGWVLYARDGAVSWVMNHFGDVFTLQAEVPAVLAQLDLVFAAAAVGGTLTLFADSEVCGALELPIHIPPIWTPSGGFLHVGEGWGFPVDGTYRNPWTYSGALADVTIDTTKLQAPPVDLAVRAMHATD